MTDSEAAAFVVDRNKIRERKERLDAAVAELKRVFIGIDEVIDELADALRIWYLMPEVLSRPIIINLWGMTGVGKTDLVRRLVRALDFQERFAEVELTNGDSTSWFSSVASVLERNGINDVAPKIVLFDEIQRFNTIDGDGQPLVSTKFADFWELLSDGRLAKREREDVDMYMSDYVYTVRDLEKRKGRGEDVNPNDPIGIWEARNLKRMLGLTEDATELAELDRSQMVQRMKAAKGAKKIYEPVDHSKSLVIISGNLDEAFSMATMASEADVDADIFHSFTEKVTSVDIKNALTKRFKPEQVARFGNIHLIYRSLRKEHFELLIEREVERVCEASRTLFGVSVKVDRSVRDLVYRNGVFPVQGVRPVFSSVVDVVESTLSKLLFEALMSNQSSITMTYDSERQVLVGTIGTKTVELPYTGRLDKIRDSNVADVVANVSAHEAGHAVVYAVLFGLAPLQLSSKVTSSYAAGFTFPHSIHETREATIMKIKVFLAGGIAEEVLFGVGDATIGRANDREQATMLALDYVRRYGFDEEFQATYPLEFAHMMDKSGTDIDVEKMIARLVSDTHELLVEHIALLRELSIALETRGKLAATEVSEISADHGVLAAVQPEGHLYIADYAKRLESERSERSEPTKRKG